MPAEAGHEVPRAPLGPALWAGLHLRRGLSGRVWPGLFALLHLGVAWRRFYTALLLHLSETKFAAEARKHKTKANIGAAWLRARLFSGRKVFTTTAQPTEAARRRKAMQGEP